ncbi:TnsD family Tn7-like transposition protein [Lysinibacillus boronitolerans]|uniref:TnsD family Tn7-like transposition protein n=1 Tax=Lysinibacillus boronitolerans TaxID=309788 RepID=UPI000319FDED|nr:TnsD family Tn7-like transposition protein [Lysinibacillus boronitolerans]
MIIQFPAPYKDELLYSAIARYHLRSGNQSYLHTLEDLFGKRTTTATPILPCGIKKLINELPKHTTLTEKMLIEHHTLYPFYTAFLSVEKALSVYNQMIDDDGKTLYTTTGIMSSAISQNKYFHFCPLCFEEAEHGERYWHRLHQLPGQLICRKHHVWLEKSTVRLIQPDRCSFVSPTAENCKYDEIRYVTEPLKRKYMQLLELIDELLSNPINHYSFGEWTKFYHLLLFQRGYGKGKSKLLIDQLQLHEDFLHFYSEEFLSRLGITSTAWVRLLAQKHRKSFHPYHHLLMCEFLDVKVADIPTIMNSISSVSVKKPVATPALKPTNSKILERIEDRRQVWLQLQELYPNHSKTELRKIHPAVYTYLYRYDRNWLEMNSPKPTSRKAINKRVDWEKRDEELLEKVKKATADLLARTENLRRITIKALGDEIGELALLEQQLNKLPNIKEYIEGVRESEDEYRKRRIYLLIERMQTKGEPIREWQMIRKSGIKTKFLKEVKQILNNKLNQR